MLSRAVRCSAVFTLFDEHLRPGMTSADVRAVLTDRTWLAQSSDEPLTALGGRIPIERRWEDSVFVVQCLPRPRADLGGRRWSPWIIYGRVSGKTAPTLGAFLDGRPDVRLVEYAIHYPDGRLVRHRPDGRVVRMKLDR